MSLRPSEENRWPIDEKSGSYREDESRWVVSLGPVNENLEFGFESLIAKTRVDGSRVVDRLLSGRGAKEVQ